MKDERDMIVDGKIDQVKGKIREVVGVVTDNETEQAKGKAENVGGKLQAKAGEAVRDAKDFIKGTERI